jgi:hypothetical protein
MEINLFSMILTRIQFYCLLIAVFLALGLLYEMPWLFSKTTPGVVQGYGFGTFKGRRKLNKVFVDYTVGGRTYSQRFAYEGGYMEAPDTAATIPIRFLTFAPSISRKDMLWQNWGVPLAFFAVTFIVTSIVFLQDAVIPFGVSFRLNGRWPFAAMLKNNTLEG